jgi:hypothetical protein
MHLTNLIDGPDTASNRIGATACDDRVTSCLNICRCSPVMLVNAVYVAEGRGFDAI